MDKEFKKNDKKKPGKLNRALLNLLLCVCIGVFIVSAYMLLKTQIENSTAGKEYGDIADSFVDSESTATPRPVPSETAVPTAPGRTIPPHTPNIPPENTDPEIMATEEPTDDKAPVYVSNIASKEWKPVKFEELLKKNSDFIGWIAIPGTNVNYPIVWRNDPENLYYLKHTFEGKENRFGSIFIDSNNKPDFTDPNTIIYGHNIKNHSMFWTLTSYRSQSFYEAHPYVRIITPYGNYLVEIFSAYDAKPGTDTVWTIRFGSANSYYNWIETQASKSLIESKTVVTDTDKFVTLSTCSYVFTDARFVIIGKLVPTNEGDFRSDEYYASHPRPSTDLPWQIPQAPPQTPPPVDDSIPVFEPVQPTDFPEETPAVTITVPETDTGAEPDAAEPTEAESPGN